MIQKKYKCTQIDYKRIYKYKSQFMYFLSKYRKQDATRIVTQPYIRAKES